MNDYPLLRAANPSASLTKARDLYGAFLNAYLNCTFHAVDCAGNRTMTGFMSDVADNIIRVDNAGTVESETRYEANIFSPNFDKATRQRWGSTYAAPSNSSPDFATTLPEAQFAYVEAAHQRWRG